VNEAEAWEMYRSGKMSPAGPGTFIGFPRALARERRAKNRETFAEKRSRVRPASERMRAAQLVAEIRSARRERDWRVFKAPLTLSYLAVPCQPRVPYGLESIGWFLDKPPGHPLSESWTFTIAASPEGSPSTLMQGKPRRHLDPNHS
jgi:hypothetical protein